MSNRKRNVNETDAVPIKVSSVDEHQPLIDPHVKRWTPDEFLTETEAYAEYGHVLEDKELRQARHSGQIGFMRRKRTIFYRRDELNAFVSGILRQDYVEPCPNDQVHQAPSSVVLGPPVERQLARQSMISPERMQEALKLLS